MVSLASADTLQIGSVSVITYLFLVTIYNVACGISKSLQHMAIQASQHLASEEVRTATMGKVLDIVPSQRVRVSIAVEFPKVAATGAAVLGYLPLKSGDSSLAVGST